MSIITVYHGSKEKLTLRNIDKEIGHGTDDGIGFYTSTNVARVKPYGPYYSQFNFNARKPISMSTVTLPRNVITELVTSCNYQENFGEPYGRITMDDIVNDAVDSLMAEDNDGDIIGSIVNAQDSIDEVLQVLDKYGYNHARGERYSEDVIVYVLSDLQEVPFTGDLVNVKESSKEVSNRLIIRKHFTV